MKKLIFLLTILFSANTLAETIALKCDSRNYSNIERFFDEGVLINKDNKTLSVTDFQNIPYTRDRFYYYADLTKTNGAHVKVRIKVHRITLVMTYSYIDDLQESWTTVTYQCEVKRTI